MPSKIKVYTMENCPYCAAAKKLLTERGLSFEEIKVANDDDNLWDELFKKSGMRTMPQIFFDEKIIGGYTELAALDQKDKLKSIS